ncbi:unnamed protein product [Schistosoma mattheei]|uniref:Uncharacterized protein n=1 Tax=Schistosoma mattheei TaxID=31246 RepID=A0A183PXT7_9TREM|nr:unnamed protein product [Schistosoma mattheei]
MSSNGISDDFAGTVSDLSTPIIGNGKWRNMRSNKSNVYKLCVKTNNLSPAKTLPFNMSKNSRTLPLCSILPVLKSSPHNS